MPEKSIILHAHEIRRLLDVGEAQIWRPVRPQPPEGYRLETMLSTVSASGKRITIFRWQREASSVDVIYPFQPGEQRWVKETWTLVPAQPVPVEKCWWKYPKEAWPGLPKDRPKKISPWNSAHYICFRADGELPIQSWDWVSAIRMPQEFSRLTVEIPYVEVRQVQSITEGEARRVGVIDGGCLKCGNMEPCGCIDPHPDARDTFIRLWNSSYAKRGLGWDKNPSAWAVKIKALPR